MVGIIPSKKFRCVVSNIYNPCNVDHRKEVWREIDDLKNEFNHPSLLIGDFNEILHPEDRGSQWVSNTGMSDFRDFIQRNQLLDLPPSNGKFTWFRGNSKSRLDRLLINPEWLLPFPTLKTSLLKRAISDHYPLLASTSGKNWGPKSFRFLNCWLSHPKCLKTIEKSWTSAKKLPLPEKLKAVKSSLKEWNQLEFGFIDSNILSAENKIQALDDIASERNLNSQELNDRKLAQLELWDWLKRKESFWAQNLESLG